MKRAINITLDDATYRMAKQIPNFSEWVRNQLRSQRNKLQTVDRYCKHCNTTQHGIHSYCVNKNCKEYLMCELEVL
jgi:hypothetical protein